MISKINLAEENMKKELFEKNKRKLVEEKKKSKLAEENKKGEAAEESKKMELADDCCQVAQDFLSRLQRCQVMVRNLHLSSSQKGKCEVDKLQLYSDILELPQHMGGQVAEIIRAREPGHSVPDLVEIDFDILKPSTLAALQSLVVSRKRQVADETKEPKEHKKEEVDERSGVARKKPRKEKHRESKVSQEQVKHKESRDPVAESQAEDLELLPEPDSLKSAYDFFVASMLLKMSENVSEEKVGFKI